MGRGDPCCYSANCRNLVTIACSSCDIFGASRSLTGSSPNYGLFTGGQRDSDGGTRSLTRAA